MSNQESSSVLTEPELTLSRRPLTGTSHVLTVTVTDTTTLQATISDPSLRLHNGDTVVWRINGLSGTPALDVKFTSPIMQSTATHPGTFKVRVDVSEEDGIKTMNELYTITVGGHDLSFVSLFLLGDPVAPQLVIDTMGGM